MNQEEIVSRLKSNLAPLGEVKDLRVLRDPYFGWRIYAVAPGFEGKTSSERESIALEGLNGIPVEWLELLTPDEAHWAGELPETVDVETIPMWPEALARQ